MCVCMCTSMLHVQSNDTNHPLYTTIQPLSQHNRRPSSPTKSVPVAVAALAALLKEPPVRELFTRSGGVQLLAPLLRIQGIPAPNPQMLYDAALCVWSLTFFPPACHVMHKAGRSFRVVI